MPDRRLVLALLVASSIGVTGCAETKEERANNQRIEELEHPGSKLQRELLKAAEHLPPGSSVEEQTAQAAREAEGR